MNLIKGIPCVSSEISVSHLQFADDTIIFLEATEDAVKNVKKILLCFEFFSGLSVNCGKSCLYSIGVEEEISERFAGIFGCMKGKIPFKYLGLPIGSDPRRLAVWEPVIERIKNRLSEWKRRSLSFGGRVILINSVLSSLPIYYMSLFKAPKGVLQKIDQYRRGFL